MQEFNMGGRMNLQQQVNNVAAQGRYGDSMLMHVNPAEVRGLSQVAPITINPETGQPEAFLPFLAPLLGSVFGPALFGALGAGAGSALTGLAGSALGSGLAQWAATGDIKKGLLAGITGYGIGSALQGAGAAAAGTEAAAGQTAALTGDATKTLLQDPTMVTQGTQALNPLGQSALNTTMAAAQPGIQYAGQAAADAYAGAGTGALKDAFSGTFGSGMQNLAAGASQPAALAGIAGGMAPTAVMESQELFARQTAQMEADEEERKRQMWQDYPEPILYSAQGGPTNMDESLMMDVNLLSSAMNAGGRVGFNGGGEPGYAGNYNTFSGDQQRFTPARQTYDVNPAFMAGFQPETMYFQPNTINQPATATTTGGMPILNDPYTGSQGGYNTMGVAEAPLQTIDPYAAYTGSAPQGLVETGFNPVPVPELPVAPVTPPGTPPVTPPVTPPPDIPPWVDPWDNPYDIPFELGDLKDLEDKYGISPGDFMPNGEEGFDPSTFDPSTFDPSGYNLPDLTNLDPDTFNLPDGFDPNLGQPMLPTTEPELTGLDNLFGFDMGDYFGGNQEEIDTGVGVEPPLVQPPVMQPPVAPPTLAPPPVMQPDIMPGTGSGVEIPMEPNFDPSTFDSSTYQPPAMQPPVMQPPAMQPPIMQPPAMIPEPIMQPPMGLNQEEIDTGVGMQPPMIQPPMMQPPVMPPSIMQPPAMIPEPMMQPPPPPPMQPEMFGTAPPMQPPIQPPPPPVMPPMPPVMQPPSPVMQPPIQPPSVGTPPPFDPNIGQPPPALQPPVMPPSIMQPPEVPTNTPVGLSPDGTPYTSPLPSAPPGVPMGPDGQIGPGNIPPGIPTAPPGVPVGPTPMPPSIMQPPAMPTPPGRVSTPLAPSDKPMPKPGDPRKPETPTVGNISTNENGHTADQIRDMIVGITPMPAGVNYNMADAQKLQAQDASLTEQPSSPVRPTRGGGGRGGRGGQAEGGETGNIMQDPITQEVVLFITGESDNQQAVNDFVTKYGAETFAQLRDYVLKALTNENVQTEGQIEGVGNSGMADDIPGMIGANEKIAVSQDEFIVPADVVSALGDGSSDAGSNELYAMMDRVRQAKTGGRTQPNPINIGQVMPV